MLPNIYRKHRKRPVEDPPHHVDDLVASIRPLSIDCRHNILMLAEELGFNDPYLEERCGLLADRFEVFAITIPDCKAHALAISIDLRSSNPPPVMLHGAVFKDGACDTARRLATMHRELMNPSWEPNNDTAE